MTTSVRNHERLFCSPEKLDTLLSIIISFVVRPDDCLFGHVVMPDHFHLLLGVHEGGPQLSRIMGKIKRFSSRVMFPERKGIWNSRFDDVAICSEEQFRVKLNYIHNNPVKAGLVKSDVDYPWSSAAVWLNGKGNSFVTTSLDHWKPSGEGT